MKIVKDASKNDYDISINNDDQNATVKCSSGFYIQVARASLGSLLSPSVLACGDIVFNEEEVTVATRRPFCGLILIEWQNPKHKRKTLNPFIHGY